MSFFWRFLGDQIGARVAGRFGKSVSQGFQDAQVFSLKVALALTDAIIVDSIVAAVWPASLVLAAMIGVSLVGNLLGSPETTRILIGLLVLMALLWAVESLVRGSGHLVPHVRFWLVTRLGPRQHLRLVLYHAINEWVSGVIEPEKLGITLHSAIVRFLNDQNLNPEHFSFEISRRFAHGIFLHIVQRLVFAAMPLVAALLYYRLFLYPQFVRSFSGGLSTWRVAAYPVAALLDLLFASHFRLALAGHG